MKRIKLGFLATAILIICAMEIVNSKKAHAAEELPDCNCYEEVCCGFRGELTRHCPLLYFPNGLMYSCYRDPNAGSDPCSPECCHECGAEPPGCYGCAPE